MRVLHPGHDHDRDGPARQQPGSDGGARSATRSRGTTAAAPDTRTSSPPFRRLPRLSDPLPPPSEARPPWRPSSAPASSGGRTPGSSPGAATYTDDVKLPGLTYAAILRSPYAHARITSIDVSAREALARRDRGLHRRRHQGPGGPGALRLERAQLRSQGAAAPAAGPRQGALRRRRRRDGRGESPRRRARRDRPHRRGLRAARRGASIPRRWPAAARRSSTTTCPGTSPSPGWWPAATRTRHSGARR